MHQVVDKARSMAVVAIAHTRKALRWLRHSAPHAAQSMVEYAIIAAIVAVIAVAAVKLLGESVTNAFSRAETSIDSAGK